MRITYRKFHIEYNGQCYIWSGGSATDISKIKEQIDTYLNSKGK